MLHHHIFHCAHRWEWYCNPDNWAANYLSKIITGWLPGLLMMLWQCMVLPLSMLLLVQVGLKTGLLWAAGKQRLDV